MECFPATLFVVDDDSSARNSIAALATATGTQSELYASGEEFLDRHIPGRPGCVISDLRLPGIDGLQLHERVSRSGEPLPVILVSAFLTVPIAVRAMQQGVFSVLEKPYQSDELLQVIHRAMEADRRARAEQFRTAEYRNRIATLDPRERRTAELITSGTPNKIIARDLGVSQRTVDRIRATVLEKMGVQSAVELVRIVSCLPQKTAPRVELQTAQA